jgi:hypothetical protein
MKFKKSLEIIYFPIIILQLVKGCNSDKIIRMTKTFILEFIYFLPFL